MVESIKELKKICHNNKRFTDRPWWYRISRFLSLRITWCILKLGIKVTPNQITVLCFIIGISGAFFTLNPNYLLMLLGFIMLFACFTIDGIDGELARYWKNFSTAGTYIDKVGHAILDPLLYFILTYSILRVEFNYLVMFMGFLCVFLINFIKTNVQLNNYIFLVEVMLSPRKLFQLRGKHAEKIAQDELIEKKGEKTFLQKLICLVNSVKAYVPTVFYFLVTFTLDHFQFSFLPQWNYKFILLTFYTIFLSLTAIGQINYNLHNLEKEQVKQFGMIMKAIRQEETERRNEAERRDKDTRNESFEGSEEPIKEEEKLNKEQVSSIFKSEDSH